MNTNTMPLEAETRILIDRSLENLGWKLNGKEQNVFYEQPRTEAEKKKLGGKRPDYVLYSKESDKPLIVIEAKKKGSRIDTALEQGINYARVIEAPLVFATDGVFCKAFHTVANRPPILNGEEVDEFIREALALRYLTSYSVNTVSPKVQYDRKELIRIFDEANNMLRGEGLRAGIERFGEFANILFLKLISESEQIKRESGIPTKFDVACSWDSIKQIPISTRIEYINKTVYDKLNALYDTDIFTPLQIRDASILKEIMDKLDPLMLTDVDSDVKGDAFEYFLKAFCFLNFFDFKVLQIQQFCCIIFIEHIGPPLIWFCNFYFNGFLTNMLYFFKNFLILFLCSALGFPNIYYSAKITG